MARLVRLTMTVPLKLDASALPADGKPISICTCGLSKRFPFCDGAHKIARTEEPGKLYTYNADATAVLSIQDDLAPPPPTAPPPAPASAPSPPPAPPASH